MRILRRWWSRLSVFQQKSLATHTPRDAHWWEGREGMPRLENNATDASLRQSRLEKTTETVRKKHYVLV